MNQVTYNRRSKAISLGNGSYLIRPRGRITLISELMSMEWEESLESFIPMGR